MVIIKNAYHYDVMNLDRALIAAFREQCKVIRRMGGNEMDAAVIVMTGTAKLLAHGPSFPDGSPLPNAEEYGPSPNAIADIQRWWQVSVMMLSHCDLPETEAIFASEWPETNSNL